MEIKNIRKKRGLTMQQLADGVNMTSASICLLEQGRMKLTLSTAGKIANFLNCRVSDIIGETEFDVQFRRNDFIKIPLFANALKDVYTSDYFTNINHEEIIQFDHHLLKNIGFSEDIKYDKLFFIRMVGDMMLPLISHDDNLLISTDITKDNAQSNRFYLVNEKQKLRVKRIIRETPFSNTITVKNDNQMSPNYQSYTMKLDDLPDDFLVGKVVYLGKRLY